MSPRDPSSDKSGEFAEPETLSPDRLIEDLRLHQVELEVQNRELMAARERLDSERQRYRDLFQNLSLPALVIDRMAVVVEANRAALAFFGFRSSQSIQRHAFSRLLSDRGGVWLGEALDHARREGVERVDSVRLFSGEGLEVPVDLRFIRLDDAYHLNQHLLVLAIDRSAEEALDHERRLYQALLDNTPALITAYDASGRCLLINDRAARVLGVDAREAIGRKRLNLMPSEQAAIEQRKDSEVWREGEARSETLTLAGDQGRPARHYAVTRFPLKDADDRKFAVATISTDVTEIEALRGRLDLATQIFSRGGEGILILDKGCQITFANRAIAQMLGLREDQLQGKTPTFVCRARHREGFLDQVQDALAESGHWEGELWLLRNGSEAFPTHSRLSAVTNDAGEVSHYVALANDITDHKAAEEEIERLAYFDALTGLPNRFLLRDRVEQAIQAGRRSEQPFAVIFLDLDHFKEVNDIFGHDMGDQLLIAFTQRLLPLVRDMDTICRLGGDELVLLLPGMDRADLQGRLDGLIEAAVTPFEIGGHLLQVSASVGVAMFPDDGADFDSLLKNADMAMYQAKEGGRNQYCFFDRAMAESLRSRALMKGDLINALDRGEFFLSYQPQVESASGRLIGFEALLRWQHPERGLIMPGEFIPLVEQSNLVVPVGERVVSMALAQLAEWSEWLLPEMSVSVNISADHFWRKGFLAFIEQAVASSGVPSSRLVLELTETTAMRMPTETRALMQKLAAQGVYCSIDDFGTGYSSLAQLYRFPLKHLKIDREFVSRINDDQGGSALCRAILQMADALGLMAIAEGVETQTQLDWLKTQGCPAVQGFLISRPLAAADVPGWCLRYSERSA